MLFAGIFRADASYIVYHSPERRGRSGGLLGEVHCFAKSAWRAEQEDRPHPMMTARVITTIQRLRRPIHPSIVVTTLAVVMRWVRFTVWLLVLVRSRDEGVHPRR